jgi:hypothetical protein
MRGKVLSSGKSKRNSEDSGKFYENGKLKKQYPSMLWLIVKVFIRARIRGLREGSLRPASD